VLYKKYVITQSKTRKLLSNEQKSVQMSCYCKDSKEMRSTVRLLVSTLLSGKL
jgi:hypothetical protein